MVVLARPPLCTCGTSCSDELHQPIWGWLGRRDPFEMAPGYEVAEGMRGYLSGTPPVLALAAVDEGVKAVAEAGIDAIRAKADRAYRVCDRAR